MTILWIALALGGTWLTWQAIRAFPWRVFFRLLAYTVLAILAILALIHFDINLYTVLDAILPDFGGNP